MLGEENADLSKSEEEVTSTEPETEPVAGPEVEIISSVTEKSGVEEEAAEEAMREQGEQIHPPDVVQPKLIPQTKPKKETMSTSLMKIQRPLADVSKQIEKQTTQINKINQNLKSLQKQMKAGERQTGSINQIRSQMNKTQKQISQVYKIVQKRSNSKLQSNQKVSSNTRKRKKNKVTRMRQ